MAGRVEQEGDLGRLREHFNMQGGQLVTHSPPSDQGSREVAQPGVPDAVCPETLPAQRAAEEAKAAELQPGSALCSRDSVQKHKHTQKHWEKITPAMSL